MHRNGKCPVEQKEHGFHFCPNCGFKLSESSSVSSKDKEILNDMNKRY